MPYKNCKECEKSFVKRCNEHKWCDDCGTKENLVFRIEGLICESCHKIRVEKRVVEFDGDTTYENIIICPYCGDKYNDCWEWSEDEGEYECNDCERKFAYDRYVDVTYSTYKLDKKV